MAGRPIHVNEPLARVIASLLMRQEPEKARDWIDGMKKRQEKQICENNLQIMGNQQGEGYE